MQFQAVTPHQSYSMRSVYRKVLDVCYSFAINRAATLMLWMITLLILFLLVWSMLARLDVVVSADGELAPQQLVSIVQLTETGIIRQVLVREGDFVKAGQALLVMGSAPGANDKIDKSGLNQEITSQTMQLRRIDAQLSEQPMLTMDGDDPMLFAQVQNQFRTNQNAYDDAMAREHLLLVRDQQEQRSADEILSKLKQTLPSYQKAAQAYAKLEKEGYFGGLASAEKQREATEKTKDLDSQTSTVAAMNTIIKAQQQKITQLRTTYQNALHTERDLIRAKIAQLETRLHRKTRDINHQLTAPQDGVIKTTSLISIGTLVHPGTTLMTIMPKDAPLYADVLLHNNDIGMIRPGQAVQISLTAYPYQEYGMLSGKIISINLDSSLDSSLDKHAGTESNPPVSEPRYADNYGDMPIDTRLDTVQDNPPAAYKHEAHAGSGLISYKARIEIKQQQMMDDEGNPLMLDPGMPLQAEIHLGTRTPLSYLISPFRKLLHEAGTER